MVPGADGRTLCVIHSHNAAGSTTMSTMAAIQSTTEVRSMAAIKRTTTSRAVMTPIAANARTVNRLTLTTGTPQINEWTAYRAFTSVRDPLTSAHTASPRVTTCVTRDTSVLASMAEAARPTMPLLRARSVGSVSAASAPMPKANTTTNT